MTDADSEPLRTGGILVGPPLLIGHGGCLLRDANGRPVAAFIPSATAAAAIAAQLHVSEPATEVEP